MNKSKEQGYIYVPYIIKEKVDIDMTTNEFLKKYQEEHRYCPKCGSDKYMTTLVAYMVDIDNLNDYKDLNNCDCSDCGDKHIVHERISINELRKIKLNKIYVKNS